MPDDTQKIRFVRMGEHELPVPKRSTGGSAGYDLMSRETLTIWPGQWRLVPTGFGLEMPAGYEAQVRPRSGLASKKGITVLNSPGTIDSDYRGFEIGVVLINHGEREFEVKVGDRIAQLVFSRYVLAGEDEIPSADRQGGFGSTGGS